MVDLVLAQRVVDYLNELTELDRVAVGALISNRVPCNLELANHPTCQVMAQNGGNHVGLLGLLNGLCGVYDDGPRKNWGAVAARFDEPKVEGAWCDLLGFEILPNEVEKKA
jgi:hypothetical protein